MIEAAEVKADFEDYVQTEMSWNPADQPANYASSIGHPCERYLFYLRARGREREPAPRHVLKLFMAGREAERRCKKHLMAAGWEWYEEQGSIVDTALQLRGRHDGYIGKPGRGRVPVEIKSVGPWDFDAITDAKSGPMADPDSYTYRGVVQFNSYLVKLRKEAGLFIFINRLNDDIKPVEFSMDVKLWDATAQKLKRVNKALAAGEPPERVDGTGRDKLCRGCAFAHICLPDLISERQGITFEENPEIERKLDRIDELTPLAKELDGLKRWRSNYFEGRDAVSAGKWLVEGTWVRYTKKPQPASEVEFWRPKMVRITGGPSGAGHD